MLALAVAAIGHRTSQAIALLLLLLLLAVRS
jgi:hypothetical protein